MYHIRRGRKNNTETRMQQFWEGFSGSAYIQSRQRNGTGCRYRLSGFLVTLGKHKGVLQERERVLDLVTMISMGRIEIN